MLELEMREVVRMELDQEETVAGWEEPSEESAEPRDIQEVEHWESGLAPSWVSAGHLDNQNHYQKSIPARRLSPCYSYLHQLPLL